MPLGAASAEEKKEIVIGAPVSMTGILALDGVEQRWAYEEAVKDINESGGIFVEEFCKKFPVTPVMTDDESEPGKAAAAVEKLVKLDKVDLLLSTHSTPLIIPTSITAEKYKKYYHANSCIIELWKQHDLPGQGG